VVKRRIATAIATAVILLRDNGDLYNKDYIRQI
jgi:hypothetical protein